jgi:hypothetical protein
MSKSGPHTADWDVLLVRGDGDRELVEPIAERLRTAGYDVVDPLNSAVGQSVEMVANMALNIGSPVVLCGTKPAVGDKRCHHLVATARSLENRVYVLQMERGAHIELLAAGEAIVPYWRNPDAALDTLISALRRDYPAPGAQQPDPLLGEEGERFRAIARGHWEPIDASVVGVARKLDGERRQELYVPMSASPHRDAGTVAVADPQSIQAAALHPVHRVLRAWARPRSAYEPKAPEGVGSLLQQSNRLVILGEAGAGKSTLLRWIASTYLARHEGRDTGFLPHAYKLPDHERYSECFSA